jgi:3-oxoacyl-[acyl-carrier protein] reductase
MRLKDKVAIVTGGAHGLGEAYVMGFARKGARLVIADIDYEAAKLIETNLSNSGTDSLAIRTDVSSVEDTKEMARRTVERFGRVDILVNNAAVLTRGNISRGVPFDELDLDEWDRVINVNVKGVFLSVRAVSPYMKEQRSGKIINVSSGQFYAGGGPVKYAHYITSKGAVIGLTRALARELGDYNINVNCLAPGSTLTEEPDNQAMLEFRKRATLDRCLKRLEYPDDLVGTVIFLASPESDFITGQTIVVDGGARMI